jgi:uncharacterized membrane protein
MNLIKDLLTGQDNVTYQIARVSGAAVVVTFIALSAYAVIGKGQPFDPQQFGIGAGAVIAAMGAALKLTEKSEAA